MTKENQIRALAELDGIKDIQQIGVNFYSVPKDVYPAKAIPDYLNSHDAIIPLLRKQSGEIKNFIVRHLCKDGVDEHWLVSDLIATMLATPPQLAEALLKAHGLWKD